MRLPKPLGTFVFWLAWPALWVYLRGSQRSRVIIVCQGKVLLIKNWLGTNDWGLPGGGRHGSESAVQAAEREVYEETGIDIKTCEKIILFTNTLVRENGFFFVCDCLVVELGERPVLQLQGTEIVAAQWIATSKVASLKLSPVTRQCLAVWSESSHLVH